jgi:hypothetical protein
LSSSVNLKNNNQRQITDNGKLKKPIKIKDLSTSKSVKVTNNITITFFLITLPLPTTIIIIISDDEIKILYNGKPTGKITTLAKLCQVYLQQWRN